MRRINTPCACIYRIVTNHKKVVCSFLDSPFAASHHASFLHVVDFFRLTNMRADLSFVLSEIEPFIYHVPNMAMPRRIVVFFPNSQLPFFARFLHARSTLSSHIKDRLLPFKICHNKNATCILSTLKA